MSSKNVNYYRILGVRSDASAEEIKKRYRNLSKKHHPDANGSDGGRMALINEAYAVLSNPSLRQDYLPPGGSGPIKHSNSYQTHKTTPTQTRKKSTNTEKEEPQNENWSFLWWYLLAIPIAILIVTFGGPLYNRLFQDSSSTTQQVQSPKTP